MTKNNFLKFINKLFKFSLKLIVGITLTIAILVVVFIATLPKVVDSKMSHAQYINGEKLEIWHKVDCGEGFVCGVGKSKEHNFYMRIPTFSYKYLLENMKINHSNIQTAMQKYLSGIFLYSTGENNSLTMVGLQVFSRDVKFKVCKIDYSKNVCKLY